MTVQTDFYSARALEFKSRYPAGETLDRISGDHGISRERVLRVLERQGISGTDGGGRLRARKKREEFERKRDARYLEKYGLNFADYNAVPVAARRSFVRNRFNARYTFKTTFDLKFVQWWDIWTKSGKWDLCGRGKGNYWLSRVDKSRGYEVGNVEVVPSYGKFGGSE
jgi:hypothetical protein